MTAKLGWCLTGHHTDCIIETTFNKCTCECHVAETNKENQ